MHFQLTFNGLKKEVGYFRDDWVINGFWFKYPILWPGLPNGSSNFDQRV